MIPRFLAHNEVGLALMGATRRPAPICHPFVESSLASPGQSPSSLQNFSFRFNYIPKFYAFSPPPMLHTPIGL